MDGTTKAIAHVLRQWHENEPKPAQVIDLAKVRRERDRKDWLRTYTKPMPPGGRAA